MGFGKRLKSFLFPQKYRLKQAEARIGRLEKQVDSLQAQVRDFTSFLPGYTDAFKAMMAPLVPHVATGVAKRRVGATDDGAYIMLDDFSGIAAAYSLGIGKEVSWDLDVARGGIPVFQFDPTVQAPPVFHPLFRFESKRIVAATALPLDEPHLTVEQMVGTPAPSSLLLKIDIEGAEWEVFDSVPAPLLASFRQIAVEFHGFNNYRQPGWLERATRVFRKLAASHKLIHAHGNNYNPTFGMGSIDFPYDLELTFALTSAYELRESFETFPGPLDKPNKPGLPDLNLGNFRLS